MLLLQHICCFIPYKGGDIALLLLMQQQDKRFRYGRHLLQQQRL